MQARAADRRPNPSSAVSGKNLSGNVLHAGFVVKPLAYAIGLMLLSAGAQAAEPRPFSGGWFNAKNVGQAGAAQGARPGMNLPGTPPPLAQQQQANQQLQRSLANLGKTASAIAAQQAAQAAARQAALAGGGVLPDGLAEGGLKVDRNPATEGWINADAPTQQTANGQTTVGIRQTGDKAILNWETFNVGKHTTVEFKQQKDWAVLNRVNDPQARPSQIQGRLQGDGTVMVVNRNGVVFSGSSQVNVRNLVAAAATISDEQFNKNGIYSAQSNGGQFTPSFSDAMGGIEVNAGAQIVTRSPDSVTEGGGYVLLLGHEVNNAGALSTVNGQTLLAAGDNFIIRKGVGTNGNQNSSTRGNEVAPRLAADSSAGRVTNSGLIAAVTGDITLAGRQIRQAGALVATSSVNGRGTLHLLNSATDSTGSVTLAPNSVTAVLVDADEAVALDGQRDALIANRTDEKNHAQNNDDPLTAPGQLFDNLSTLGDRRDLSRVEIVSGGAVDFQGSSLTLATGGQVAVSAVGRAQVAADAAIDVSGAVGVRVAMESNNLKINVQGNEQRDAPVNRDDRSLNNSDMWIDRRSLIYVAPGVGGYDTARWYTSGGLLEVGGYLGTTGHGYGEWAAQGGMVQFDGGEVVTQRGSHINLSGGTLDVQSGAINLSWLRGRDGRLYEVSSAPGDVLYTGLYKGFEDLHARWGEKATRYFYNPLIAPRQRLESGYTAGRDAGKLVVSTGAALLEGDIEAAVYQGPHQNQAHAVLTDSYKQVQNALAGAGQLIVGRYDPVFDLQSGDIYYNLGAVQDKIVFGNQAADIANGIGLEDALPEERQATLYLNTDRLNGFGLGGVTAAAKDIVVDNALEVAPGGALQLYGGQMAIKADLTARSGTITLDNTLRTLTVVTPAAPVQQRNDAAIATLPGNGTGITVAEGVTLDARGLWSNLIAEPGNQAGLGYVDGGRVTLRQSGDGDIVLGAGSLIDVSSGAAVLESRRVVGGKGGDVTLMTNAPLLRAGTPVASGNLGQLALDGDVLGYGVSGAGTLKIQSGGEAIIARQPGRQAGSLPAGEAAPETLRLLSDLALTEGQLAPFDVSYQSGRRRVDAGDAVRPGDIIVATAAQPLKVEGGDPNDVATWLTVPQGVVFVVNGQYLSAGNKVPPGALVTTIISPEQLAGLTVSGQYFPHGLPLQPKTLTVKAHERLPESGVLPKGSWLAAGAVLETPVAVQAPLWLDPSRFQSGFARYDVTGLDGVTVTAGTQLNVVRPVWLPAEDAWRLPGGLSPERAMQIWLAPLYLEDPQAAQLTQRAGASLALHAGDSVASLGRDRRPDLAARIETGASITVDPSQSIEIGSLEQLTVDGTLNAWSGNIILNQYKSALQPGESGKVSGRSIWIGDHARLDVAARAATAVDIYGRHYGWVPAGGNVLIGGRLNPETGAGEAVTANAPEAFVIIRPGAVLDASGDQGLLSVTQPVPTATEIARQPLGALRLLPGEARPDWRDVSVASNGGRIELVSYHGIYADGSLLARAGGKHAVGGTLSMTLEAPEYGTYYQNWDGTVYPNAGVNDRVLAPREMVVAQHQGDSPLGAGLRPGELSDEMRYGAARVGVDRIQTGGFDNVALLSNGVLSFDGDVALTLGQSLQLYAGSLALAQTSAGDARVDLAAPYVRLAGPTNLVARENYYRHFTVRGGSSLQTSQAQLHIAGDLIDVRNSVTLGAAGDFKGLSEAPGGVAHFDWRGFDEAELVSRGAIRFLKGVADPSLVSNVTELLTPGNLTLKAAQLYPATDAIATVRAGYLLEQGQYSSSYKYDPTRTLTIARSGQDTDPALPYAVFGKLALGAATINQGGVVRAPLGQLAIGSFNEQNNSFFGGGGLTDRVNLLPGSVTSVSAAGLTMPYGGTVDNVSYTYDGKPIIAVGVGSSTEGQGPEGSALVLGGRTLNVAPGAQVDLSGGGELTGTGFVSGRGGSTDARYAPLVQMKNGGGFTLPGLESNPIYALLPGVQPDYAPVVAEGGAVDPQIGRQITIGADVPGLPAGTYTLMPSTYALLPGAFRVEINGLAAQRAVNGARELRNGSYALSATLATANTPLHDVLPTEIVVTPAALLRRYSQYNETGYADFLMADAARAGVPRPELPVDGKALSLNILPPLEGERTFQFAGDGRFAAAEGGFSGSVMLRGASLDSNIELLAVGATPSPGYVPFYAEDINAIGAGRVFIGGGYRIFYTSADGSHKEANYAGTYALTSDIVLRDGAALAAPEVFLLSRDRITLEPGSSINALGLGKSGFDAADGIVYSPGNNNLLAVSNGRLQILAPQSAFPQGHIQIGSCAQALCDSTAGLYSEGSIIVAAQDRFDLAPGTQLGTRRLVLGLPNINIGSDRAVADAMANGVLPAGLMLSTDLLNRLLTGTPALEELELAAGNSFNFYGSASLDTLDPITGRSRIERLILNTPAIYGLGTANDVAGINTGTLVWTGASGAPGAVIAGGAGTGDGALQINAARIEFGYGPQTQRDSLGEHGRLALGFSDVTLNAGERITGNQKGSLAVYHRQGAYTAADGYSYRGGNLHFNTPLITGEAGSINRFIAGGSMIADRPAGVGASTAVDNGALGAELSFSADRIALNTDIALPSGKLTLTAKHDIALQEGARVDMAGRSLSFNDVTRYSWGGEVMLQSEMGNIMQAAGSIIDLSAQYNRAGLLQASALGAGAGVIDMRGQIFGGAGGEYDAGGSQVPYDAGRVELRGQRIEDFAALNRRLNAGGVFGARRFQIKQGDLTLGDEVKAREVAISLDGGRLTVAGMIDAGGQQVGSIRLAARDGLTLTGEAVLDAHGALLRVDSYGQIIDSPNRATVELNAGDGRLVLQDGATIDLRHGTGTALGDGQLRGTLELSARRLGGVQGDDIAIDAGGNLDIRGARSIAVNGVQRYDDAAYGTDPAASGRPYQVIDQAYLDDKHRDSLAFINRVLANDNGLQSRLAGLRRYGEAFHVRPGVEIVSQTADGDMVVQGDLDLSRYRYAGVNPQTQRTAVYGSGEPGALVIRAGGNLDIYGSINDGFAPPPDTPDDHGWVLTAGVVPFGGEVVVPRGGLTLATGTKLAPGAVLNYDVTLQGGYLPGGVQLPATVTLDQNLNLAAGTVLSGDILAADGATVLYRTGTLLRESIDLPPGTVLGAGTRIPQQQDVLAIRDVRWPKGVPLPARGRPNDYGALWTLAADVALPVGARIPSDTDVVLPDGAASVQLRTSAGERQGANWALAPMLAPGSSSWSLRLVGGADTAAADSRATRQSADGGSLRLSDMHYTTRDWRRIEGASEGVYVFAEDTPGWGSAGQQVDSWMVSLCGIFFTCREIEAPSPGHEVVSPIAIAPALSVLRSGTGDLDLAAAGDFRYGSPYGVYTAGTPSASAASYNQRRGKTLADGSGSVLGQSNALYEPLVDGGEQSLYQAWYPERGGNLHVRVGGNISGDNWAQQAVPTVSGDAGGMFAAGSSVGNWLWRQGSGAVDGLPSAWWINFGTYAAQPPYDGGIGGTSAYQSGFVGIGTLGGGNLNVDADGSLGTLDARGINSSLYGAGGLRSQGLVLAVGGTGRVGADGQPVLTGGGDMAVRAGGFTNPNAEARQRVVGFDRQDLPDLNGVLVNLRGHASFDSGAIGGINLLYGNNEIQDAKPNDPRVFAPYTAGRSTATGGLVVMPGDATFTLNTRGDLVLSAAGDPGRTPQNHTVPFSDRGTTHEGGLSWFSLWTDHTAIDLFSAGGNLTPLAARSDTLAFYNSDGSNYLLSDGRYLYPSILRAVAANGSLYYGNAINGATASTTLYGLLLAPSVSGQGQLELLARDSIYAGGLAVSQSGAQPAAMATPFNPGFVGLLSLNGRHWNTVALSGSSDGISPLLFNDVRYPLFTFGPNSAADGQAVAQPARFYALDGDIVGLRTGSILTFDSGQRSGQRWYEGGPVRIMAGRDIVNAGHPLGTREAAPSEIGNPDMSNGIASVAMAGNVIVHGSPTDISLVSAGRDILYGNFNIAGPGLLEITAGRNLLQEDKAAINSMGPLGQTTGQDGRRAGGAGITVAVGMGESGADYAGFIQRYLDPANQAEANIPLVDQSGKVVKTYQDELAAWLAQRFGFAGTPEEASRYFAALPAEQQRVFVRQVYFAELKAAGREYTDAAGPRTGSYLRGREAIAALFPEERAADRPSAYQGDVLIYGDAGIQSQFGGDIQVLTPGGGQTYGQEGEAPTAKRGTPGVITLGAGNIQMYALDSILLGQSRIMTTFGGDIQAWSAQGDINAGRGAKTTLVYTPPKREYDVWGNVTLSPLVPSTGAGIATLNPIPEVPPGDIDLTAPLGTVDAGEAGIRVSGNVNIAALQVVNAANIQVQGQASGIPMTAAVNVGALTSASQAAGSAVQAAEQVSRQAQRNQPSTISVEILGYGGERLEAGGNGTPLTRQGYDPAGAVQVVGAGKLTAEELAQLSERERNSLLSQ
ncbi:filamentous haemagglutinin family protein [Serratia bockelmannii]|uniref:filamentous haemagglutinin family protein n=1 Tax=Serratia bockelmannii TaxID=2703793 RepID=UPI002479945A|nr:filamentous haemagglutinin family protein [Serratia bockelmannii]MDH7588965.1 filamentous hemagglutinin family protein [Serratia bockelmannii]